MYVNFHQNVMKQNKNSILTSEVNVTFSRYFFPLTYIPFFTFIFMTKHAFFYH